MSLDLTSTDVSPVVVGNEALKMAARAMRDRISIWREADDAFNAKGYVDDSDHIQVKQNRLMEIVERNAAEDAQTLWPQRPFIPFRAKRDEYQRRARNKVKAIDGQMDRAQFFEAAVLWTKYSVAYGNAGLEPAWDVWTEAVTQANVEIDELTGQVVGITRETYNQVQDALRFKVFHPGQCFWHPLGGSPLEKPFLVLKEVIPRQEAERLIDERVWKPPKGVSVKDFKDRLKNGPSSDFAGGWTLQWKDDLGAFHNDISQDVVVMCRLYSRNRWITWLNYDVEVRDQENGWINMDPRVKPIAWMQMNPHIGESSFYGTSEWERIRDIATLDDDIFSLVLDAQLSNNLRWYVYDRKYIDPEDLKAQHGGMVELRNGDEFMAAGGDLSKAVNILDPPEVQRGLLEMHGMLVDRQYERTSRPDVSRGIAPRPKQTKGATEALLQEAQVPHLLQTRFVENGALLELAHLVIKQCDANMTPVQIMDSAGISWEEAIEVVTPDPSDIPGGFEFEFEGAERAGRRVEKDEKNKEFFNFAANQPMMQQGPGLAIMLRKMAERTEVYSETEIDQMFGQQAAAVPVVPPGEEVDTVGADGAVAAPGEIATPAQNQAAA